MRVRLLPIPALMIGALAAAPLPAAAQAPSVGVQVHTSSDPILTLRKVAFEGGKTLDLSVGIGSGAFRGKDDPADIFHTVSDRGPNFTCGDAEDIVGVKGEKICGDVKRGRIYPVPDYSPSIYRIQVLEGGTFRVLDSISLKDARGNPVDGMLNPLTVASTEQPLDAAGNKLKQNPNAVDAEGIVRLSDGSFWIGDENGPSILHAGPDGRIQVRHVPAGTEKDYAGAGYEVKGTLPAILAKRALNRGIESMAVSEDGKFLYFVLQNPLANPDNDAYADAANTRLFKLDRATMQVAGEYVYVMEPTSAYRGEEKKKQSTVRISELMHLAGDDLLILERTERTTKIFRIALAGATDIRGGKWDDAATAPSLEQADLAKEGVVPAAKSLVLDTADHPGIPPKIEGMALFGDGALMLINDDDFGIDGKRTAVMKVTGLGLDTPAKAK
ncbi:esterase-like activity of phytase family protein [Skermanella rosea]|uniref:esterase-like activity of phytase family protein n=1 Tax=Skermanella rosea TaxID=1817965 RepID=UPI00193190CC|nr:esterase-like activity of phytase family protein [Skermanella rosea]UEM04461.1 esterase-like activity of phytase family protein [Skermanella rosea]